MKRLVMKKQSTKSSQSGYSMLEVLVAMGIGLVVLGSAISMQVSQRKAFSVTESRLNMQTNARFAFEFIASNLRELGALGCRTVNSYNLGDEDGSNYVIAMLDETVPFADFRAGRELIGYENTGGAVWDPVIPAGFTFMAAGPEIGYTLTEDSDVITMRGAMGPTYSVDVGAGEVTPTTIQLNMANISNVALRQNNYAVLSQCDVAEVFQVTSAQDDLDNGLIVHGAGGQGFNNASASFEMDFSENSIAELRRVAVSTYFVAEDADGNPTLFRDVDGVTSRLVQGVETMQIEYGVNTDSVGTRHAPEQFRTADWVDANNNWANVVAVRLSFIMRSRYEVYEEDLNKTYRLPGAVPFEATHNDKYARLIYTSTINLRNRALGKRTNNPVAAL